MDLFDVNLQIWRGIESKIILLLSDRKFEKMHIQEQ